MKRTFSQRCWGRFSTLLCGRKKRERGRKKMRRKGRKYFLGAGEGFQQCFALKPSPASWKMRGREEKKERGRKMRESRGEGKKIFSKVLGKVFNNVMPWILPQHLEKWGEGKKKDAKGKGRKYLQRCWGRFSTILCFETFPSTLKNEGEGRKKRKGKKKGEMGRKNAQGREKNIFKCAWEDFHWKPSPAC